MVAIVVQSYFDFSQRFAPTASSLDQPLAKKSRMAETIDQPLAKKSRMAETKAASTAQSSDEAAAQKEKREKLMEIVHTKGVSLTALRHIVNKLAQEGEHISRHKLEGLARERFLQVRRAITLPLDGGGEHVWHVADFMLLVASTVRSSPVMEELFSNALQRSPCSPSSPWRLLVTWDEFTPGSLLRPQNQRKGMVVNMSFQELGPALHSDNCWWTVAVVKTKTIGKVVGGWSRMLRDLLKMVLLSPTGIQIVGLPMKLKGELVNIYAKVGSLLSDGDGLRMALQWMGTSSLHPCFRHWNVLKKGSERAQHNSDYVEIDCHDPTKFKCWSNTELATTIDICAEAHALYSAGRMQKGVYQGIQKRLGFRARKDGLLADPELRRHIDWMGTLRYDWPHTFLADGFVGAEIWALVAAGEKHKLFSQKSLYDFLKEPWQFSRTGHHKQKNLCRLFNEQARKTNEDSLTIKASMGDLMGLYGLLRHYSEDRVPADRRIAAELHNMQLACKAVDILIAAKKRRTTLRSAGQQLEAVLEQHMRSHVEASGNARVRPKSHWAFDIAECMQQDEFLLDAFGTERLHLRVKKIAEHCQNILFYDESVMRGVTNAHMNSIAECGVSTVAMVGPVAEMPGAPGICIGDQCRYFGEHFSVGDFVCRGASVG